MPVSHEGSGWARGRYRRSATDLDYEYLVQWGFGPPIVWTAHVHHGGAHCATLRGEILGVDPERVDIARLIVDLHVEPAIERELSRVC